MNTLQSLHGQNQIFPKRITNFLLHHPLIINLDNKEQVSYEIKTPGVTYYIGEYLTFSLNFQALSRSGVIAIRQLRLCSKYTKLVVITDSWTHQRDQRLLKRKKKCKIMGTEQPNQKIKCAYPCWFGSNFSINTTRGVRVEVFTSKLTSR